MYNIFEIDEELTPHEKQKLDKKRKLVRNDFKGVGQYKIPLIR